MYEKYLQEICEPVSLGDDFEIYECGFVKKNQNEIITKVERVIVVEDSDVEVMS